MTTDATPWWAIRYEAMAALHPAFAGEIDVLAEAQVEALANWLELRPGHRLLDVGCGAGRHAVLLQERGLQVTGVDLSPRLLRLAGSAWEERASGGAPPQFVPGDMRWLPVEGPFDAVIFMDMALGVFDRDTEHLRCLESARRVLAPGGRILIELFNPYYWSWEARTTHFPAGGLVEDADVVRTYRFDPLRGRLEDRVVVFRDAQRIELPVQSLRTWTPAEIVALLKEAGFRYMQVLGSEGWEPPQPGSPLLPKESPMMWVAGSVP